MENKLATGKISESTQKYLDISEVRDDVVIMRDGTVRAVILVSSINFALKSEDEQNAIIAAYVGFLNNIDFPLQIVIQSRELNIESYIETLRQKEKEQTNELLKMQTKEYIQYIIELISMSRIMKKNFYVIIPYNPLSDRQKGFFSRLGEAFKPDELLKMKEERFQRYKRELEARVEKIISGLASIGLNSAQLDTQSLIELYYNTYNPATSSNQNLADVTQLKVSEHYNLF